MGSNEGDISVGGFGGDGGFVVKVTSQSVIKPSSPTPPSRRRFQLSLFDRLIAVDQYATFLSFYPAAAGEPHAILRGSLSEALSRFYPFAGEIKLVYPEPGLPVPSSSVDCNDRGVVYLEAEANQTMAEFLGAATPPSRRLLEQHLAPPRPVVSSHAQLLPMAAVKTTVFRCGG
ncbi:unnamed protein product [Linum tenue]|uniref:Uncharacterized protein n=1 Tax=Linum tenue TaxID=586396 RepID=A0AAV0NG71_9ROSI|nr:unnamed protein product [Linum tenue]